MAQETQGGRYLAQINGPAKGVYEMEPQTHSDLWLHDLCNSDRLKEIGHPKLKDIIEACFNMDPISNVTVPSADALIYNLRYATVMARVFYLFRDSHILPNPNSVNAMWETYKRVWNTTAGAATQQEFVRNYHGYTGKVV